MCSSDGDKIQHCWRLRFFTIKS